jgi:hypothetical protein
MSNPWLDIPLADYEAHMALPAGHESVTTPMLTGRGGPYFPPGQCYGGAGVARMALRQ